MGNQPSNILGLARLREGQQDIVASQRAQISVHRLGGVKEVARGARGGERSRDFAGDQPCLANASHHHAASTAFDKPHRPAEGSIERFGGGKHGLPLSAKDDTAAL